MKHSIKVFFALAALALLTTSVTQAETHQKMAIALHTDDFNLHETDISELAIGESQTIETDSGKVIDLLRTADGVEVYVDGELLDINIQTEGLPAEHLMKKHIEITCDDAENCDESVFVMAGDDLESVDWIADLDQIDRVHQSIVFSCSDDDEDSDCSQKHVWVSAGEDLDFEELHKLHANGNDHKVIIIKKELRRTED